MFEPNASPAGTLALKSGTSSRPLSSPSGRATFGLLCHASRIGGVIGKSGAIIKQLQQETAAKIRVEDTPPGCEDRVITIIASNALNRALSLDSRFESREGDCGDKVEISAAQEALIRVFERILSVAAESDGDYFGDGIVSCRLLADKSCVGSVIGKGGKVVEKIRTDTGCKIRVLRGNKSPSCALPNEELIEMEGDILAVKKALVSVSQCLQDCPPFDKTRMDLNGQIESVHSGIGNGDGHENRLPLGISVPQPLPTSSVNHAIRGGHSLPSDTDMAPPMKFKTSQQEVVFRILCSNDRIGGVIGKGGTIIRGLISESGASIVIGPTLSNCGDRLITITAMESPELRPSLAQNAVDLVFNRSLEVGFENGLDSPSTGSRVSARLVILSNQVGCLLGKGGSIVSDMRRATGAVIKIIGGAQVPKCAAEYEHVVQIVGEVASVRNALYNVTGRLRNLQFLSKMAKGPGSRSGSSLVTGVDPYGQANDHPSRGVQASVTSSRTVDQNTTLTQSMEHLGLSHKLDRPSSPKLWSSQNAAGVNPRSGQDFSRGLTSAKGGLELGSGKRSAIVMNTAVEIVIPENVFGSVYGEDGSNLTHLRLISGAKVTVHEPQPETTDRIVVISGSPNETQAAQSLLQAFILAGYS